MDISPDIQKLAPEIRAEIEKASSILLHCHPSPDPDSVGSALAMKFAIEQLGKKATVIKGDSDIPRAFSHFPGASSIVEKTYLEINQPDFDLFLILDSARIEMISRRGEVKFPPTMKTIAIDHHQSNDRFAEVNLVVTSYPANCLVLFDLFKEWGIKLTPEIASNLFVGMYSDTGAFKYTGVDARMYAAAAELALHIPSIPQLISKMENSNSRAFVLFEGEALRSIEELLDSKFALSFVPHSFVKEHLIPAADVRTSEVASFMLTVYEWQFVASAVEIEPKIIKFSFRSKDIERFDVAKLTSTMGGGGHRAASGLILKMPFAEAKALVVAKAKELYNL